jgi:hypothetical protein
MTLLLNLDQSQGHHLVIDLREESNTQWDYGVFVLRCIEQGYLQAGMSRDQMKRSIVTADNFRRLPHL